MDEEFLAYFTNVLKSVHETGDILFYISTVIFVVGILGNTLTIGLVLYEKKFHTPTFTAIACLSISDLIALILSYMAKCIFPFSKYPVITLSRVALSCLHVSTCHVIMFAILRYLIIAYPLWSRRHLRVKVVLITSLLLWMYGATYGVIHKVMVENTYSGKIIVFIVDRFLEIVVPLVLILIFHCLKIRHIKRCDSQVISIQSKRMFKMTSVIACAYFVTMMPIWIVCVLIGTNTFRGQLPSNMYAVFVASVLIHLLNFVIDPFIYFIFTPIFRKQIMKYCKCSDGKTYDSHLSTDEYVRHLHTDTPTTKCDEHMSHRIDADTKF